VLFLTLGLSQGCKKDDTPTAPTPVSASAPTCSIATIPDLVCYDEKSKLTITITGGLANGSISPASGGCSSFTGSSGLTCETAKLTTPGVNTFTLTVSNSGGTSTCTATVDFGCQNCRVWNNIAIARGFVTQRLSYGDFCDPSVATGAEITTTINERQLHKGKTMQEFTDVRPGHEPGRRDQGRQPELHGQFRFSGQVIKSARPSKRRPGTGWHPCLDAAEWCSKGSGRKEGACLRSEAH
jgi:hypothetical protein